MGFRLDTKWLPVLLAGFWVLAPCAALALGEQTGRLSGHVTEAGTEAPVPGATVTVTSPALPGGAQRTTTAEDGYYAFDALPPGAYTIEVSYAGMKPLYRQTTVAQGELTPLEIAWSAEMAQTETTVVVQQRTMTRPDSTTQGRVMTSDEQSKLASGRSYQSVAQQVAGVSGGANPDVRGASLTKNRYLIDGLDITDPLFNTASADVNFDSLSSFEILTGGMEAQYNSMGGVINLVTATGGDELRVDASIYGNHYKLSSPGQFGGTVVEGARTFSDTPRPPTQSFQGNINVSGPILKQKLWFNTSVQYDNQQASVPAAPPLNIQAPNRSLEAVLARTKLTYVPTPKHRFTLSGATDPTSIDFQENSASGANSTAMTASTHRNRGGGLVTGIWEYFLSDAVTYKLQGGAQLYYVEIGPQGHLGSIPSGYEGVYSETARTYDYDRPRHYNSDDGTAWYNSFSSTKDIRNRYQLDQALIWRFNRAGRHEAQFGIQSAFLQRRYFLDYPGQGFFYSDRDGGAGEAGLCVDESSGKGCFQKTFNPAYRQRQNGWSTGLYAQDRWKPTSWLTVLPGLRFDYGMTRDNAGRVASRLWGFGPRLGAAVDLTGDQKTILSAYYGRANEVVSLYTADRASEPPASSIYTYNKTTRAFEFSRTSGGPGSIILDPNGKPPHSDEISFNLRRELVPGTAVTLGYTWKRISNVWDKVEVNSIWDPSGTRVVGFANGEKRAIYKLTTPDENTNTYNGFDVIFEGKPSPSFLFYSAYTLSFKTGPGTDEMGLLFDSSRPPSPFENPRQAQFYDGYAFGDIRHQLKVSGAYTARNFTIGPNVTYQSGAVLAKLHQMGAPNNPVGTMMHSPMGTQTDPSDPNNVSKISEFRTPDLLILNLRAQYNLQGLLNQDVSVIGDVFNALNLGTATAIRGTVNPQGTFGNVSTRQAPLRVQLGLRYQY